MTDRQHEAGAAPRPEPAGPLVLPALSTARLTLRQPVPDDCEAIAHLVGDLDVARWLGRVPHPYTLDDARQFVTEVAPYEHTFAICRAADDVLMGTVGWHPSHAGGARGEFGYWLGKLFWGQGYATEAARSVIAFAFGPAGLADLGAHYFDGNARSAAVLTKLGFQAVGRATRPCRALGRTVQGVEMILRAPTE